MCLVVTISGQYGYRTFPSSKKDLLKIADPRLLLSGGQVSYSHMHSFINSINNH